jgi:AraC family transcriptional regulator
MATPKDPEAAAGPELTVDPLLATSVVTVRDVYCRGSCRHKSPEECARSVHLVFPYRGTYVRHVGHDSVLAEASQVLFFNSGEGYRVSHPLPGGDASLDVAVHPALLHELAPKALIRHGGDVVFRQQSLRIDARAQALVALLRHSLRKGIAGPLEAESLALTLIRRTLGRRNVRSTATTLSRRRLVDRIKLALAADLSKRWTLSDIAAEVGGSPVYLTQVFQQVEGVPLYRYQLELRLARALDLLAQVNDLSALSHDLGFSSHSHFSAAFQRTYGRSPSEFRQHALRR